VSVAAQSQTGSERNLVLADVIAMDRWPDP